MEIEVQMVTSPAKMGIFNKETSGFAVGSLIFLFYMPGRMVSDS